MRHRVGLFGCGQIGSAADETLPIADPRVLSHARACAQLPGVELVGLCDHDIARAQAAADRRSLTTARVTDRPADLLDDGLDIAVIAATTSAHIDLASASIDAGVGLVMCEKPVGSSASCVRALAERAQRRGARVMVNYLRRYLAPMDAAAAWVRGGALGPLRRGVMRYPKGLLNWGSHGIDLLNWMLGPPQAARFDGVVEDGRSEDPTQDVTLFYGEGLEVQLLGIDHREVTLFELDLLGRDGRFRMDDLGRRLTRWTVEEDPGFPGYRTLHLVSEERVDLESGMAAAWRHVMELAACPTETPLCGLAEAIDVHRVLEAVAKSQRTGTVVAVDEA